MMKAGSKAENLRCGLWRGWTDSLCYRDECRMRAIRAPNSRKLDRSIVAAEQVTRIANERDRVAMGGAEQRAERMSERVQHEGVDDGGAHVLVAFWRRARGARDEDCDNVVRRSRMPAGGDKTVTRPWTTSRRRPGNRDDKRKASVKNTFCSVSGEYPERRGRCAVRRMPTGNKKSSTLASLDKSIKEMETAIEGPASDGGSGCGSRRLPVVRAVRSDAAETEKWDCPAPRFWRRFQPLFTRSARPLTISAPLTRRRNASSLNPV